MILHPITGMPVSSFHRLKENAQWLRTFLEEQRIDIHPESVLHKAIFVSENLPRWSQNPNSFPQEFQIHTVLSEAIGLSFLVRIIYESNKHQDFKKVIRLLPYLAKENPLMTETAPSTQSRNFVFELEIACLFLAAGISAESLSEPDVKIIYNNAY